MKKRSRLLLAGVVLAAALSFGAMAAEGDAVKGGIYGISGTGATLTPQTESQTEITPITDEDSGKTGYYANAVRLGVTAEGLDSGKQYLLLVLSGEGAPTEENIAYIDQAAAGEDGKISFNAYPSALTSGTYRVYIVGGSNAFSNGPAATFSVDQKYTLGDVNNDGQILVNDAQLTLNYIVKKTTLSESQRLAADVTHDGQVLVNDAQKILNYIVGKIKNFD